MSNLTVLAIEFEGATLNLCLHCPHFNDGGAAQSRDRNRGGASQWTQIYLPTHSSSVRALESVLRKVKRFLPMVCVSFTIAFLYTAQVAWAQSRGYFALKTQLVPIARISSRPVPLLVTDGADLRFKRLSANQGLSQTRASSAVQDSLGFMWFATQYGLNRYDGYKVKVYKHEPGRPDSLSCVYVHSVMTDRSGNIWVGCDSVLDKFDPVHETFAHFPLESRHDIGPPGIIEDIHEDHFGSLWLTTKNGLYRFEPLSGTMKRYKHEPDQPASISSNAIHSVDEDRSGKLWVATHGGLEELDRQTGRVTFRIPLGDQDAVGFHEDRFGVFWISRSSSSCPLSTLDRATNTLHCYSIHETSRARFTISGLSSMLESRDGTMWFASRGAGLLKFDRSANKLVRYVHHSQDTESLGADQVLSLYEDREGEIWTCMHQVPPNYFSARAPDFQSFTTQRGSLAGSLVTTLFEDHDRTLWIGSTGALNRIDGHDDRNTVAPGSASNGELLSIVENTSGELIGGTFFGGLQRIDPKTGSLSPYGPHPRKLQNQPTHRIMRLMFDRNNTLWAATWGGLLRFDATTGDFTTFRPSPDLRVDYSDIKQDPRGGFWLGGESGLQYFNPETNHFTVYKHDPDDPRSLSYDRVTSVYLSHAGELWVGTQDGLNKLDERTGKFSAFYTEDGLAGNVVSCILEDDGGRLWMGTNNGLSRLDPKNNKFTTYSSADGLPGQDLTGWSSCYKSSRGEMFFGGFSGAVAFYPSRVQDAPFPPPTVLTDFRLLGSEVPIGKDSPLKASITLAKSLTLTSKQRFFSFEFAGLSYYDSATNRYRYRLEGFDSDWHEVDSSNRAISYTTLPKGDYTFRVESATSRGAWSEPGVSLRLRILPPWWNTWWFIATYATSIVLLLWGAFLFRLRAITNQYNIRLAERLGERNRIARELHDTLLQGFQGLVLQFHGAVKNLRHDDPLYTKLEQVLEHADQVLTDSRLSIHDLRDKGTEDLQLPDLLSNFGRQMEQDYTTCLVLSVTGECRTVDPAITREMYFVGREAISNAFRHSGASQIDVNVSYGKFDVTLTVQDNGKGMNPLLPRNAQLGHWGLIGMQERAERIGGKFTIKSAVDQGTEVSLAVPNIREGLA
jgi:signal transduction histidine kinase/ligand-binding sensor domain-containing protein